jgi:regulator of protease activity HflC (stomatin/prohibitin superfamily)
MMWFLNRLLAVYGFMGMVEEGTVGIFYQFGALLPDLATPGLYTKIPWITTTSLVNIRPQTDQVHDVQCGTSDGIVIVFSRVDVGNTLQPQFVYNTIKTYGEYYDQYLIIEKIRHQMQVICSSLTSHEIFLTKFEFLDDELQLFLTKENEHTGLVIDFVRFPEKPIMPESIREKYLIITEEKVKLQLEMEKQKTIAKEAETEKIRAQHSRDLELYNVQMDSQIAVAQTNKENRIRLMDKENEETIHKIDHRILFAQKQLEAEIMRIFMEEEAKGMQTQLNVTGLKDLLLLRQWASLLGPNTKFFLTDANMFKTAWLE